MNVKRSPGGRTLVRQMGGEWHCPGSPSPVRCRPLFSRLQVTLGIRRNVHYIMFLWVRNSGASSLGGAASLGGSGSRSLMRLQAGGRARPAVYLKAWLGLGESHVWLACWCWPLVGGLSPSQRQALHGDCLSVLTTLCLTLPGVGDLRWTRRGYNVLYSLASEAMFQRLPWWSSG